VDDYERRRELARLLERRRRRAVPTRPVQDAPAASPAQQLPQEDDLPADNAERDNAQHNVTSQPDDPAECQNPPGAEPEPLLRTLRTAETEEHSPPTEPIPSFDDYYGRDRREVAFFLMGLTGMIVFLSWALVSIEGISGNKFFDFIRSLAASLVSLLATVVGFYFAKKH
jgi:hypothetical protein